jgi:signal peptidase II
MLQALTIMTIALLIAIDQIIKFIVLKHLEPIGSITVIDKVLSLTYVENTGAAFGSFSGYTRVLSVFTALVLIVGLIYLLSGKIQSKVIYWGLTLIIAGGAANLIDRVGRHFVIDYIDPLFVKFAVFNFADILVTVGAFIVIIYLLYEIIRDSKNAKVKE